jgi:hypothetical protein
VHRADSLPKPASWLSTCQCAPNYARLSVTACSSSINAHLPDLLLLKPQPPGMHSAGSCNCYCPNLSRPDLGVPLLPFPPLQPCHRLVQVVHGSLPALYTRGLHRAAGHTNTPGVCKGLQGILSYKYAQGGCKGGLQGIHGYAQGVPRGCVQGTQTLAVERGYRLYTCTDITHQSY